MSRQNKQEIRKLRKKLRQIELLERQALDRELNDEESLKVVIKKYERFSSHVKLGWAIISEIGVDPIKYHLILCFICDPSRELVAE